MKIYLDVLLVFNFILDFIILLSVKYLLKRKISTIRIIFASLFGEISIILILLPLNSITLLLNKFLISLFMIIIAFKYVKFEYFKRNLIYFYIISIIVGGVAYFFDISFKLSNDNLIFNIIILLLIVPYFLYKYVRSNLEYKENINLYHYVEIYINKKKYEYKGYIDTGNRVVDPYKNRSVILINDKNIKINYENSILIPYRTISENGILKCIKPDRVILDKKIIINNVLISKSMNDFDGNDFECILPNSIKKNII